MGFTVNNPALKRQPDADKAALVAPIMETIEREGKTYLALLFSEADMESAKASKSQKTAGFRMDATGQVGPATFHLKSSWIGVDVS